jgi:hypothetical protein
MARYDWYTNKDWNSDIENAFFTKLGRAKNKAQYLRIQASILAKSRPETALRLLDEYFALGDRFDRPQAHLDRATAFVSLGEVERDEAALGVETQRPNVRTQATFDLPLLIAEYKVEAQYARALAILQQSASNIVWHADRFRWHAAQALIGQALGKSSEAREHARTALDAAYYANSGMRYHPSVGLVGNQHDRIRRELEGIVESSVVRSMIRLLRSLLPFGQPR